MISFLLFVIPEREIIMCRLGCYHAGKGEEVGREWVGGQREKGGAVFESDVDVLIFDF